ncbi:MAG TPA: hypothetical protein VMF12_13780 [Xanthobacteraceae bacterium]|nr:hypothetical protein [Xanthobacteraceae bacterium]
MAMVVLGAPDAGWRLGADPAGQGSRREASSFTAHTVSLSSSSLSSSDDAVYRTREVQYRNVELGLLRRRYALVQQPVHRVKWRPSHRHLRHQFHRHQYWAAAPYIDDTADGVDLPTLMSEDVGASLAQWASSIFLDAATSSGTTQDGGSIGGDDCPLAEVATGTLTLSGGSIADTSKVTVDAGGALQLVSTPAWSFNAKIDGEFAPDTSKATAGGTLQLFSTPNWSFIAKFDGEFAPQPQLYAGSGALHYAW